MRDGVEIKVTIGGPQVKRAVDALGLHKQERRRSVGFIEDATVGAAHLRLLDEGVVLRVRERAGERDDSTVKLRPCRRSQLTEEWLHADKGDGWTFRLEADWSGTRRVLAASCVADRPEGRIAAVRAGKEPIRRLFNDGQEQFLADCTHVQVNLDALTLLPPIDAIRWHSVTIPDLRETVVAERWVVGQLDFLELSIKVDTVGEAEVAQPALEQRIRALGLQVDPDQDTKTRRVLDYLIS
jgi:hypothetical protein